MIQEIKIVLTDNPTDGDGFEISIDVNSGTDVFSNPFTFRNTTVDYYDIWIRPTKELTAISLWGKLSDYFILFPYITVNQDSYGCTILIDAESVDASTVSITGDIVITYSTPVVTIEKMMCRSTYTVRLIPVYTFDRAEINVYTWRGGISDVPLEPNYSLSKQVAQLGQQVISFDINELVTENINNTISQYTSVGILPININNATWIRFESVSFDNDSPVYNKNQTLHALYGYGFYKDLSNPTPQSNILITGNKHVTYKNNDSRVYFYTENLNTITVNGISQMFSFNTDLSNEFVASLNLGDYTGVDLITLVFEYQDGESRTIVFEVRDECRHDVVNCVFINRFGVPQSFFFSKVSKHSEETDGDDYRKSTADYGLYDPKNAQYVDFNVNGRGKILVNTDYLDEEANETIKELILSENIWLIEGGVTSPVKKDTKSIEFKTNYDRLIQYSMTFKYAFDTINQV